MMNKFIVFIAFFVFSSIFTTIYSQEIDVWKNKSKAEISSKGINSEKAFFDLDIEVLKKMLKEVPKRNSKTKSKKTLIYFPLPDGTKEVFETYEHSVLSSELAAKYPSIKSYFSKSVKNPSNT